MELYKGRPVIDVRQAQETLNAIFSEAVSEFQSTLQKLADACRFTLGDLDVLDAQNDALEDVVISSDGVDAGSWRTFLSRRKAGKDDIASDAELVGSLSTYIDDTRIALKVGIQEIQRIQEEMEDLATSRSLASASTISEVIADLERAHLKVTAAMMDYEARRAAVREQRFDELKMMEPLH